MFKTVTRIGLAGLLAVASLAQAAEKTPESLRIGYQKGSVSMVLAKSHALLEKRFPQTKFSWVEFPAGPQMLEALNVGSIDLGSTGDIPPIFAQAADRIGFTGVLIPTGRSCEDAWLVAASMIPVTQRLKFLVALRPSVVSPTVAARQAATLDRLSNGRALFNLVTGSDPQELAGDGVFLDHTERYEASAEFTRVWRRLLEGETVTFEGKHIHVRDAQLYFPPVQQPRPPLYFGGSSDVAQELAAEQVDLYLTWGEPPELVKEKVAQVRAKAAEHGRTVRFGIRLHVIVRETNDEAWQAADRLIAHLDDDTIAKAQAAFAKTDSVGQHRMASLHNGKRENLEISPNLWAGVGLVRGGAGTALVGDGPTVAARINEYAALGIDSFILSGYPHLEEAYKVGELLFPHLDVAIPEIPQPRQLQLQGEAVANAFIPRKVAQS